MYAHRHTQLPASFEQRIHARIIRMHAIGIEGFRNEAFPLVVQLSHSARSKFMAPFERANGFGSESRFVVTPVIETAPNLKTIGIGGELFLNICKLLPRGF